MIHIHEEAARCLLCENAPCGEKTARAIRAIRFENLWTARELFDQLNDAEIEAAQAACIHYDRPLRIAELKKQAYPQQCSTDGYEQYGYRIIDDLILGLQLYMRERGITELKKLVGEELKNIVLPHDLDRETMVFPKIDRAKCIGCGRCYISCRDGGHQAISFEEDRQPRIIGQKCVGCHLCRLVCPTGAIGVANRMPKKK